jgi:hypothetical protein
MSVANTPKSPVTHQIIRNSWPFIGALLVFAGVRLAHGNPDLVERYYSTGIYPFIAKVFSSVSRTVPFSLWDLFWILNILVAVCGLVLIIFRKVRFKLYLLRMAQLLCFLYSFFYLSWGFNYFRPDIEKRLGWSKLNIDEESFRSILDTLIIQTNKTHVNINTSGYPDIDRMVEESYRKNSESLGINYPNGTRRPKSMIFSSYFAKSSVSGYFGPFFNEINLNSYILPIDYPYTLAHEKAHQFGITSEAEANLAAFVVCVTSEDTRLNYSGYLFLMLYFLNDARQMPDYHQYIDKIDKPVIEDIRYRNRYYNGLENETLEKIQSAANDVYLKSNNIKKGIQNYNHVVTLVLRWYNNTRFMQLQRVPDSHDNVEK